MAKSVWDMLNGWLAREERAVRPSMTPNGRLSRAGRRAAKHPVREARKRGMKLSRKEARAWAEGGNFGRRPIRRRKPPASGRRTGHPSHYARMKPGGKQPKLHKTAPPPRPGHVRVIARGKGEWGDDHQADFTDGLEKAGAKPVDSYDERGHWVAVFDVPKAKAKTVTKIVDTPHNFGPWLRRGEITVRTEREGRPGASQRGRGRLRRNGNPFDGDSLSPNCHQDTLSSNGRGRRREPRGWHALKPEPVKIRAKDRRAAQRDLNLLRSHGGKGSVRRVRGGFMVVGTVPHERSGDLEIALETDWNARTFPTEWNRGRRASRRRRRS